MSINNTITSLEEQSIVHDFLYKDGDAYLAHIFKMYDEANSEELQVGYYSPQDACIHVFVCDEKVNTVIKNAGEEPFKEPESEVKALDLSLVSLSFDQAKEKADAKMKELKETPTKVFVVLQNLGNTVFNFTFLTAAMKTINIKIDADSGEISSVNSFSLFDMAKGKSVLK